MNTLAMSATCRRCGGQLDTVNNGNHDGCTSTWVGKCVRCCCQWVVRAEMIPIGNLREMR